MCQAGAALHCLTEKVVAQGSRLELRSPESRLRQRPAWVSSQELDTAAQQWRLQTPPGLCERRHLVHCPVHEIL